MATLTTTRANTAPLSQQDVRLAESSSRTLRRLLGALQDAGTANAGFQQATLRVRIDRGADGESADVALPEAALPLLLTVLREMGSGKGVAVVATDAEVTTQQAADFLNVSRPYFVKLLEAGKIPFRTVGPRRRVRVADLLRYREREEAERHRGLDELAAEAQRLGMY
ncbi:MAG TPA: excisionase family DNA-binding protein [Armatimonadaceae bacterium]|jgi:excisionase family DNA binding protein|nr:excisionase family DNA-binding protein [Armatimonadaceae bacterium]